jgi:hypothetical protein
MYGPLEPLARNRVNLNKVTHWPDMLRGRRFPGHQPGPRLRPAADVRPRRTPDPAGAGVGEYGRIAKTEHLLRVEGHEIRDEDVAWLSPLKHRNLNVLGRYSFTASTAAGGGLRPLRDPDAPELDEGEED